MADLSELTPKAPETTEGKKPEGKKKFKKKVKNHDDNGNYGLNLTLGELFHTDDPEVRDMFKKASAKAAPRKAAEA